MVWLLWVVGLLSLGLVFRSALLSSCVSLSPILCHEGYIWVTATAAVSARCCFLVTAAFPSCCCYVQPSPPLLPSLLPLLPPQTACSPSATTPPPRS